MSATVAELRSGAVDRTIAEVKGLIAKGGVNRPTLDQVLKTLQGLAAKRELWTGPNYAPPKPEKMVLWTHLGRLATDPTAEATVTH